MPTESKEKYVNIEVLVHEYKTGHNNNKFLPGFGDFIVMNTILGVRDRLDKEKKGKIQSDAWPVDLNDTYFQALANSEYTFYNKALTEKHLSFSKIMEYVNKDVASDLDTIAKNSDYLVEDETFIWAWTDEMLRASLRGIKKSGCSISGLPLHYQDKKEEIPSGHDLNKRLESIDDRLDGIERKLDKQAKKSIRWVAAGLLTISSLFIGGGYAAYEFFLQKEAAWETKVDSMPSQFIYHLESGFKKVGIKYMQMTGFEIDEKLSFEDQWTIFWNQLEDKKKKEFMDYAADKIKDEELIRLICRIFIEELQGQNR